MRKAPYFIGCAISGAIWSILAHLTGGRHLGADLWAGMYLAPVIGLIIGFLYQPAYRLPAWHRLWLSLESLFIALTLFALCVAAGRCWLGHFEGPGLADEMRVCGLRIWTGVVATGQILVLWPAAFVNHEVLGWFGRPRPLPREDGPSLRLAPSNPVK